MSIILLRRINLTAVPKNHAVKSLRARRSRGTHAGRSCAAQIQWCDSCFVSIALWAVEPEYAWIVFHSVSCTRRRWVDFSWEHAADPGGCGGVATCGAVRNSRQINQSTRIAISGFTERKNGSVRVRYE